MRYQVARVPESPEQLQRYLTVELQMLGSLVDLDAKYTSAQLLDKASVINTRAKLEGLRVWDSTGKVPLWSQGKLPEDPWVSGSGVVVYSPV